MKTSHGRFLTILTLVASLYAGSAMGAGTSIIEANVQAIEPGGQVAVSQIPDGPYLRSVNDPDDIVWERLPEYRTRLMPAPAVHESVALRQNENDEGQDIYFMVARTSDRFYVRLRWRDRSREITTQSDRFRDGAAVQFSLGDESASYMMGSGPEEAVNIWYWRSDHNAVESLAAGGPGSTTRLPEQPVSGDARYLTGNTEHANQWVVVMSRPIKSNGKYQVSLDRDRVPLAFALWQGGRAQRDGLKSASQDWIVLDLSK